MKCQIHGLVRICQKCARSKDGYWYLFCAAKSPYDHATTKPCDFCGNIRFTAKIKDPNVKNEGLTAPEGDS